MTIINSNIIHSLCSTVFSANQIPIQSTEVREINNKGCKRIHLIAIPHMSYILISYINRE